MPTTTAKKPLAMDARNSDYFERAKRARKMRKMAPATGVVSRMSHPMKDAVKQFSANTGGQDGEWHWFYGLQKKAAFYADHGYEPYIVDGHQFHVEDMFLWRIPTEFYEQEIKAMKDRDALQIREKTRKDTKDIKRQRTPGVKAEEEITMTRDGEDLLEES